MKNWQLSKGTPKNPSDRVKKAFRARWRKQRQDRTRLPAEGICPELSPFSSCWICLLYPWLKPRLTSPFIFCSHKLHSLVLTLKVISIFLPHEGLPLRKDDAGQFGAENEEGKTWSTHLDGITCWGEEGPRAQQVLFGMSVGKKQQWGSRLSTPVDC